VGKLNRLQGVVDAARTLRIRSTLNAKFCSTFGRFSMKRGEKSGIKANR
jgi:hypothetical protein